MSKYTIGTDPEFFGRERESKKYRSMIPFINGTKNAPEILECGSGLQRDNVALEFASPPVGSEMEFVKSLRAAFTEIVTKVPNDLEIVAEPSAYFEPDQLNHPDALEFGCEPDFDAWGPAVNPAASCNDASFRSCGGHVHLGFVEDSGNDFLLDAWGKVHTIRMMDAFHGIVSVLLDNSKAAIDRRRLYGKAGCHRPTDYGIEYRALSNFWLKSPETVMLVYRLSTDMLQIMKEGYAKGMYRSNNAEGLYSKIGCESVQEIINGGRVEEAYKVFNEFIRPELSKETCDMFDLCMENVDNYDLKKEWKLKEAVV